MEIITLRRTSDKIHLIVILLECEKCIPGPAGRKYVGCPHDCTRYIQCPVSGYDTLEKICPHGLLWSNGQQKCVQPKDSECEFCSEKMSGSEVWYSCKEFWKCGGEQGELELLCCPEGFRFVAGLGCLPDVDNSCKKQCHAEPSLDFRAKNCTSRPSALGVYWYENMVSDMLITVPCPVGTQFSPEECQCVTAYDLPSAGSFNRGCHTMVNMTFQSRDQDTTNTPSKVRYKNVEYINNESAMLRKDSSITFWYFSNTHMGDKLFLHTRILPELAAPPQAILHNGGCETFSKPTLLVGVDTADTPSQVVYIFGITLAETDEMVFLNLTAKRSSEYSDVVLRFDGSNLDVEVNGKMAELKLKTKGRIASSHGALQLGGKACSIGYSAFSGLVDMIEVTTCGKD